MNSYDYDIVNEWLRMTSSKFESQMPLFSHCLKCEKPLTTEHTQKHGFGTSCTESLKKRFTIIPAITRKGQDLLNRLLDEMHLDFIIELESRCETKWWVREESQPYAWYDLLEDDPFKDNYKELDELMRLQDYMNLNNHTHVPHTLYQGEESGRGKWNSLMVACGPFPLEMARKDIIPPKWKSLVDIVRWEKDDPLDYGGDPEEMINLGELTPFDLLAGDGEVSNPWHPTNDGGVQAAKTHSKLQKAWIYHIEADWGDTYPCWMWQYFITIEGWFRGDQPSEMLSYAIDWENDHERKMWEDTVDSISSTGRDSTYRDYEIPPQTREVINENMKKHGIDVHMWPESLFDYDMYAWLYPAVPNGYHSQMPIVDAKGGIVYQADWWAWVEIDDEIFVRWDEYDLLRDEFFHLDPTLTNIKELQTNIISLKLRNVKMTIPFTEG